MKYFVIGVYIMFVYWLSLHFPFLEMFFPALGAFVFLFVSRSLTYKEIAKVTLGAFVTSAIGTLLYAVYASPVTVLVNVLIAIWLVRKFKWNAPPIVAVSLMPFFSQSDYHWYLPISVSAAILGFMLFLYAAELLEKRWPALVNLVEGKKTAASNSVNEIGS